MAPEMPLTAHPTAGDHAESMGGATATPSTGAAPMNPHIPHAGETKAELPIDSIRAAKAKAKQ
jgi:hypothetical protein